MQAKKRIVTLIAIICAVIVVALVGFAGFHHRQSVMAQQHYEDRIHAKLAAMNATHAKVKAQKNDAKRLTDLKSLTQAYTAYRQGDEHDKQILAQYQANIAEEKQYFVSKNAAALKAATLDAKQVASADEKQLQANDHALAALLKVAKSERSVVYTDQQLAKLTVKIKALRKSYAAQLKKLGKLKADRQQSDDQADTAANATSASASSEATTAEADSASDNTAATGTGTTTGGNGSGSTGASNTGSYSGTTGSRSAYATSRYHRWTPSRSTSTGKVAGTTTTGAKASSTAGTGISAGSAAGKTEVEKPVGGTSATGAATGTTGGVDAGGASGK